MSLEMPPPLLQLSGIRMRYGAVEALCGIDLEVGCGEVLAVCGDNGAGKSSMIKIVSGAQSPSGGTIRMEGKEVSFSSPHAALAAGVATIYQDLALAPRLSIMENVFMGAEITRPLLPLPLSPRILDKRRMRADARGYLGRLGVGIEDMRRPVERMSGGQRQAVAIARALRWDARIVIMDEPTAALGVKETAAVLDLIGRLKAEGRTILLISHNMKDVVAVADRVAILKAGRKIIDRPVSGLTTDSLAHLVMTGEAV